MSTFNMGSADLGGVDNAHNGDYNVAQGDVQEPEEQTRENMSGGESGDSVPIPSNPTDAPVVNGQLMDGEYWRRVHNGMNDNLAPSSEAQQYMGRKVPENTLRSSKNGFKLLGQFILALVNDERLADKYSNLASVSVGRAAEMAPGDSPFERIVMSVLLLGRSAKDGFDDDGLKRLRHFLIEFSTRYVSPRTKSEVMPSTMLNYVRGVQRRLSELGMKVNLFSGPMTTSSHNNNPVDVLRKVTIFSQWITFGRYSIPGFAVKISLWDLGIGYFCGRFGYWCSNYRVVQPRP